ncbi:HEXXH motif domain-containing protein [Micromonospora zingiberis]|uniref:HEXXH motif domain-containing protein n=1 Tax=Micromonospora zingiberis TaxID=2053011 RepID=A0A4R0GU62_9ACTN|nr:HEXXH motif domain-containing protein [Micromonospora zingiberis]TCC00523.1 HEXXH motif domain-containing protein [Micromonospora zingiberis]
MIPTEHRLPRSVLDELAAGRGGADAVARLRAAQHSKSVLLVRSIVLLLRERGHPDRAAVEAAYRLLAGMRPDQRATALGHPPVAAWAFGTAALLGGADAAQAYPGLLAAVAATAAVRAGTDADLDVPLATGANGRLDLPGLGTATLPVSTTRARIRVTGGGAWAYGAGERVAIGAGSTDPRWQPMLRLEFAHHGLRLSLLLDTRTWRHVPGIGAGHRIGGGLTGPWRSRLDGAWRVLVEDHRPVAEEISGAMRALVPVPSPRAGSRSGTFHHAFGSVAMSLPPDARSAAVVLAHEIQHAKLAALNDMFALLEPGPPELFYAPWRTDPRPLDGLLHGVYAHLGVAGFWRRQARVTVAGAARYRAEVEFARWTRAAGDTVRVLAAQRRLTPVGRHLVDGMAGVLARWATEPVTSRAAERARQLLDGHRNRWDRRRAPTG